MIQTFTIWSNGHAEINTGQNVLLHDGVPISEYLDNKLEEILLLISSSGISQLHVERDEFRKFEHTVTAGKVASNDFGTTVSSADFDLIMQNVDAEIASQAAAEVSEGEAE